MNNYQWLLQMDGAERKAWFDAEHVETEERALDGDTDALESKSADLIHEYYKPMVAELQAKVDRLTAERDDWKEHSRTIEYRCKKAETDCGIYRKKFGKCIDYADAIHALMDDEGMA